MSRYRAAKRAALLLHLSPPSPAELRFGSPRSFSFLSRILSPYPPLTSATKSPPSTSSPTHLLHQPPARFLATVTVSPTPSIPQEAAVETETDESEGEEWEEEEDVEPVIGDGGDGGGVVLRDVVWGERALSAARQILLQLGDEELVMYAFKVTPKGYLYVRLDKLTHKYGCPSMEEIEKFNHLYKQKLDEIRERGEIPVDVAIEVSSPGAERLLKVPQDLDRFKDMPMWVRYMEEAEDGDSKHPQQREKVFVLVEIDTEMEHCVWKLANVEENRGDLKGRPLSKKQRDWRLRLPFSATERAMLYLDSSVQDLHLKQEVRPITNQVNKHREEQTTSRREA